MFKQNPGRALWLSTNQNDVNENTVDFQGIAERYNMNIAFCIKFHS